MRQKICSVVIENAPQQATQDTIEVKNLTKDLVYKTKPNFSDLEQTMILKGGKINAIKDN